MEIKQKNNLQKKYGSIKDKLGKGIDPKILDVVIALNLNNIPTSASCEGHLNHGEPFPWVDLGNTEDNKIKKLLEQANGYWQQALQSEKDTDNQTTTALLFEKYHLTTKDANVLSYTQSININSYLREFYQSHKSSYGPRIITVAIGPYIRIQPEEGPFQLTRNKDEQSKYLKEYQNEFKKFASFLHSKV